MKPATKSETLCWNCRQEFMRPEGYCSNCYVDRSVTTKNDLSSVDDLLHAAVAQADDLADVAVAEAPGVRFTDRGVSRFSRCLVAGDSGDEPSLGVGHGNKCTENLTGEQKAYRFLYMEIKEARRIARAHNNGSAVVPNLSIFSLSAADVLALNSDLPKMRRMGTDDSHNCCDLCGKTNLKHTVVLRPLDGGADLHYGTDCADAYEFAASRKVAA